MRRPVSRTILPCIGHNAHLPLAPGQPRVQVQVREHRMNGAWVVPHVMHAAMLVVLMA